MSEAAAFEHALRDNPDDLAGWCAYADYLVEHGDPRGEFMQTQIALEDEGRPKAERDALKKREAELLAAHEREWLGELVPYCIDNMAYPNRISIGHRWRRGFLAELDAPYISVDLGQAIVSSSATRLLREFRIRNSDDGENTMRRKPRVPTPSGCRKHYGYFELIGSPALESLRVFRTGDVEDEPPEDGWCDCHTDINHLEHIVASMPRIEELHLLCKGYGSASLFGLSNLTHLRVLRLYHLGGYQWGQGYEYALDVLAKNRAFMNLTHLLFHPHQPEGLGEDGRYHSYLPLEQVRALVRSKHLKKLTHLQLRLSDMGDDGVREIIASGILKRLKWLDLRHGCITDEGARLFAACPDAKKLERLDLSYNGVTLAGLAVLRKAKINAVANNTLTQQELDGREYLRQGDFE